MTLRVLSFIGLQGISSVLLVSYVSAAQTTPEVPGYRQRMSMDARDSRTLLRVELLEDERLTATVRPAVEAAHGQSPCIADSPDTPDNAATWCATLARLPLRPAIVRLMNPTGAEVGRLTLERATAELSYLAVSKYDSVLAVTVDLSADAGSYSGPVVRFLNVKHAHLGWVDVVDATTTRVSVLGLPTTLKTAWQVVPDAPRPEILLVACRPDLDRPSSRGGAVAFIITYSRLYLTGAGWRRVDRAVPGIWENDGKFPAERLFPRRGIR